MAFPPVGQSLPWILSCKLLRQQQSQFTLISRLLLAPNPLASDEPKNSAQLQMSGLSFLHLDYPPVCHPFRQKCIQGSILSGRQKAVRTTGHQSARSRSFGIVQRVSAYAQALCRGFPSLSTAVTRRRLNNPMRTRVDGQRTSGHAHRENRRQSVHPNLATLQTIRCCYIPHLQLENTSLTILSGVYLRPSQ
jgi:hypothetical protein